MISQVKEKDQTIADLREKLDKMKKSFLETQLVQKTDLIVKESALSIQNIGTQTEANSSKSRSS